MAKENKCILNVKDNGTRENEIEIGFVGKFSIFQTDMSLTDAIKTTVDDWNELVSRLQKVTVCGALSASDIGAVEIKVDSIMLSQHDTNAILNGTPFAIESDHPEQFKSPGQPKQPIVTQETLGTMSPQELRTHARNIIINKILTWDCNDVQDLADIVSKEILPIDDALNSSEALDMLIYINPPSAIDLESIKAILPQNQHDAHGIPIDTEIASIWAIDKNLNCYFVGTGEIVSLASYLSED